MPSKKAISPIIAIIIILLITIALAGAGYAYLSAYWTGLTSKQIQVISSFCLETGNQGKIMIKNIGTSPLDTNEITVIDAKTGEDLSQDVLWSSEIADSSLVLELRFDEGSGTKATDTSGQGNDGTLYNGTEVCSNPPTTYCPEWVDGRIGGALEFDGDGDHVDAGNKPSLNITEDFTLEAWIKPLNFTGTSFRVIISNDKGTNRKYYFAIITSTSQLLLLCNEGITVVKSASPINYGEWSHVAGVYSPGNSAIYINGNLEGTGTYICDLSVHTNTLIGKHGGVTHYFNGTIDEVRIYNRALSPEEIEDLAENSVTIEAGETAALTHTCTGRCSYNLILGLTPAQAIIEC